MVRGEGEGLARLVEALAGAVDRFRGDYILPACWLDPRGGAGVRRVDPARAYLGVLAPLLEAPPRPLAGGREERGGWTATAVAYNLFPRLALAWDHDGDGRLAAEPLPGGWRETGTLVKAAALLPYIRSLGCNTIHLLPVAAIGADGRKGELGSPYAVRNPYRVEESLVEPALGLDAQVCMAAFVGAAHRLGMRVVAEFVFRTASPDSDWVKERPDWFYWIDADLADRPPGSRDPELYGSPIFGEEQLAEIRRRVDAEGDRTGLPAPDPGYRAFFGAPPPPEGVTLEEGRWVGRNEAGRTLRVATAFADWPPDDIQPPWTDAAYLRLYRDPDFDYVAYNTVRMYDRELARPEKAVADLWDRIVGILPWWQEHFGIDGVMIDMGHSMPAALKDRIAAAAREGDPDFAFWDEKFPVQEESLAEGYNAVIGYAWMATCRAGELAKLLERCGGEGFPLPFFATAESHNSPRAAARAGGEVHSRGAFPFLCALPALAWLHNGFELGERVPVNTGLDFTPEEAAAWPAEKLPLFSRGALAWGRGGGLVPWIGRCLRLRARFLDLVADADPATASLERAAGGRVLLFRRRRGGKSIALLGNIDWERESEFEFSPPDWGKGRTCLLTGRRLVLDGEGRLAGTLSPGEVLWFDLEDS